MNVAFMWPAINLVRVLIATLALALSTCAATAQHTDNGNGGSLGGSNPDERDYNPLHPDSDLDGDGIPNKDDPDMDGDGKCDDGSDPDGITPQGDNDKTSNPWKYDEDGEAYEFPPPDLFDDSPGGDIDGDGIINQDDVDDDNDGVPDENDPDHWDYDPTHPFSDHDGDGLPNDIDDDDDGDCIPDTIDVNPDDSNNGDDCGPAPGTDCDDGDPSDDPDAPQDPVDPSDPTNDPELPSDPVDPPIPPKHPENDPDPPEPPENPTDPPTNPDPGTCDCCEYLLERLDLIRQRVRYFQEDFYRFYRDFDAYDDYARYLGGRLVTDADSWRNVQFQYLGTIIGQQDRQADVLEALYEQLLTIPGDGEPVPDDLFTVEDMEDTLQANIDSLTGIITNPVVIPSPPESAPVHDIYFDPGDYISIYNGPPFSVTIDWTPYSVYRPFVHAFLIFWVTVNQFFFIYAEFAKR